MFYTQLLGDEDDNIRHSTQLGDRNVSCVADARDGVGWLRDIGMIIYTSMEGVRSDS